MPCGDSGCPLYQISFVASVISKKHRDVGPRVTFFGSCLSQVRPIESDYVVFPQMHQKAELTCAQFNRTFSFALTKISVRPRYALRTKFHQKVPGLRAMKSVEWKTYRTRFLVKAKQLNSNLTFTDHLGRQHCGRKGDYLVESCDGVLSIAPRRIFEDIYVPLGLTPGGTPQRSNKGDEPASLGLEIEPLRIEKIKTQFRDDVYGSVTLDKTSRPQRKTPQPVRAPSSRLGLM